MNAICNLSVGLRPFFFKKKRKKEKFAPGLVFLFMQFLANGVSSRSAPSVFASSATYFAPGQEFDAPSQQDSSRICQSYCVLTLLDAAITLATGVSYTLHSDLSTKNHLKLGTAVLRCLMPDGSFKLAVLGGIFTQSGGITVESSTQILAAFKQAEMLLAHFRKLVLEAQAGGQIPLDFDVDSLIPEVSRKRWAAKPPHRKQTTPARPWPPSESCKHP